MFDTVKELIEKIRLGEDSFLELKEMRFSGARVVAPVRDSFADELAAFANSRGGVCVLGIDDSTREILGIPLNQLDLAETYVREIVNDSIDPSLSVITQRLELPTPVGGNAAVLKIEVARSLFVHKSPGGYFHRVGSSKREMSPEYLARLFQQRSQARIIRFDEQVVPSATMDDLEPALWERFKTLRSAGESRESFLNKLGMARTDDDGTWRPTVSGVLLASRDPRHFLPNAYIQAVAYRSTSVVPTSEGAYQLDSADITGPLDEQVAGAWNFVKRNMRVSGAKAVGRSDVPQFDATAVFEALVNAVAHRDYAVSNSKIRLRMFPDRLELYSPGALPNTMTVESLALRQAARNEAITSLLARCPVPANLSDVETTRATLMDKRGEGVSIILDRSEALSGRRPDYRVIDDVELMLTLWSAQP